MSDHPSLAPIPEGLETIRMAAERHGTSERTARKWISEAGLQYVATIKRQWKVGGAARLYRLADVDRAAERYRREHPHGGKR